MSAANASQPILYMKSPDMNEPGSGFNGFHPGTTVMPKGYQHTEGGMILPCDILCERDVPVKLRDGVTIYVDIFRPTTDEKVPCIINSSTFGKNGSYVTVDSVADNTGRNDRLGIPKSRTTGLESWEATDPGFWVQYGYAICNVDIRGCCMSEGKAPYLGVQEAQDDYDVIEWLAEQPWCNGHCTMTGNSWLGVAQWHCAALQPPHLTCIAPWEGQSDMYRDEMVAGGIPNHPAAYLFAYGDTETEDIAAAVRAYPLLDGYWKDKAPDIGKINMPAYVVASWTSSVHAQGTLRAWKNLGTKEKWLRIHNTQEWPDLYDPYNSQELRRFFDHYMKDINNGWENTPRIRVSVVDPGGQDTINRIEQEFPLARQELKALYLNPETMTLDNNKPAGGSLSYCGDDWKSVVKFTMDITEETEITGYMNLVLWAEADGYDDMDISVKVSKTDAGGNYLCHDAILRAYSGPDARHRTSLRRLDPEKSRLEEPYYTYDTVEKLSQGEVVYMEIGLWPTGMKFHPGEKLEVAISGFDYMLPDGAPDSKSRIGFDNKGNHIIHVGGDRASHLLVPFIPCDNGQGA